MAGNLEESTLLNFGGIMKRASLALAIALIGGLLTTTPSSANAEDYLNSITTVGDEWFVYASERSTGGLHSFLALQPGAVGEGEKRGEWITCEGADDPTCSSEAALKTILAWSMLPSCEATTSEMCIESLELADSSGVFQVSEYVSESVRQMSFRADPEKNLLAGGGIPLFKSPNVVNSAGASLFGAAIKVAQSWDFKTRQFVAGSLEAELVPYSVARGVDSWRCAIVTGSSCGEVAGFIPGTQVRLTFRLPNTIGGWFSGRMKDPVLGVEKFSATANRIVVQSQPVEVAALGLVKSRSQFTPRENMWVENNGHGFLGDLKITGANSWQENIFPFIENYRRQVNDTAIGTDLVWKMRTVPTGYASNCLADTSRVYGLVTTNALGYETGAPSYNNGFLEYKVAGLHYLPDGKDLVIGTYDLIMDSQAARCIYGFSKAPISATVTVVGDSGEENIATTVVSEKDGWLKLAAYGFTFSEKEIKVKVTQPQSKTLSDHPGRATALTAKQKAEIRAVVAKSKGNKKFICTGIRLEGQPVSMNRVVRLRAKLACDYAKSLDPKLSTFYQTKTTKAASYNGRVLVVSK